jgi:hypothetical protein
MGWAWTAGLILALGAARQSTPVENLPQTAKPHAVLVELFATEGCAACRPADDLLRRIDGTGAEQNLLIIGMSEHVKTMDHYGWKDPYGRELLTYRQSEYAKKFSLKDTYTPQIVINGEMQMVGFQEDAVVGAINKAGCERVLATLRVASLEVDGDTVSATVEYAGTVPPHGAILFAAVAEDETTEHVLRGENKGMTLTHVSVVRAMETFGKLTAAGEKTLRMRLPRTEKNQTPGTKQRLIVWAQEPDLGPVIGVDTRAL